MPRKSSGPKNSNSYRKSTNSKNNKTTYTKTTTYTKSTTYTKQSTSKKTTPKSSGNYYTYQANCKNGKKYIGMTSNLPNRLYQHQSGNGSAVTKQNKVVSFSHIYQHSSKSAAQSAERRNYYAAKSKHGATNVRGAGNTKSF